MSEQHSKDKHLESLHEEALQPGSDEKKKKKPSKKGETEPEWQRKFDELNDKYIRLYSEFDNFRKRTLKEKLELSKNASEEIITALLPVLDDLDRALKSTPQGGDPAVDTEGIRLIQSKFRSLLEQRGLEQIKAIGEPFDVDFHDAITHIPAPTDDQKGMVIDEIEKGYKLHGRVIRYSRVVVGS